MSCRTCGREILLLCPFPQTKDHCSCLWLWLVRNQSYKESFENSFSQRKKDCTLETVVLVCVLKGKGKGFVMALDPSSVKVAFAWPLTLRNWVCKTAHSPKGQAGLQDLIHLHTHFNLNEIHLFYGNHPSICIESGAELCRSLAQIRVLQRACNNLTRLIRTGQVWRDKAAYLSHYPGSNCLF